MAEVTIIDRRVFPSADPLRLGKTDVWIWYRRADNTSGKVRLPSEAANDAGIVAAIKEEESNRTTAIGKKLTI